MAQPLRQIDQLMQRELTRLEFLQLMGAGILGVIGVSGLLNSLTKLSQPTTQVGNSNASANGYGGSAYGK